MTSISHEPSGTLQEKRLRSLQLVVPELWASLAITVMWLAVVVDAIVGPDIVTSSAGGDHSTVPSAVVVSLFAFLGTWVVARYGLRHDRKD